MRMDMPECMCNSALGIKFPSKHIMYRVLTFIYIYIYTWECRFLFITFYNSSFSLQFYVFIHFSFCFLYFYRVFYYKKIFFFYYFCTLFLLLLPLFVTSFIHPRNLRRVRAWLKVTAMHCAFTDLTNTYLLYINPFYFFFFSFCWRILKYQDWCNDVWGWSLLYFIPFIPSTVMLFEFIYIQ